MVQEAAEAYANCVAKGDSARWAIISIFRELRLAAQQNAGLTPGTSLHTSASVRIVARPNKRDQGKAMPAELMLPEKLTAAMIDRGAAVFRRSVARDESPEGAVRRIFAALRKLALQEYALEQECQLDD